MICGGESTTIFLSAEEDLFYDIYLASLSLSTPLVRCTHMCFHHACWRRMMYPGTWVLYCCMLLLHVHTSCVSIDFCWQSLVWACEVALSWFSCCLASACAAVAFLSSPPTTYHHVTDAATPDSDAEELKIRGRTNKQLQHMH